MTLPSVCEDSAQNCGGCISSSLKSSTPWCESQDLILPNFCSFLCWRSIFDLSYIETILAGGYLGALLPFLCQRCFVKILSDLVSRLLMFSQLKLPENYIKFPILHCCIISFKDWLSEVWSNFFSNNGTWFSIYWPKKRSNNQETWKQVVRLQEEIKIRFTCLGNSFLRKPQNKSVHSDIKWSPKRLMSIF